MQFTKEQITKAKAAKSAEELIALAKENGIALTEEEAAKYYAELNKEGELADDELDNVVGGCGAKVVLFAQYEVNCPFCDKYFHLDYTRYSDGSHELNVDSCPGCGADIDFWSTSATVYLTKNGETRKGTVHVFR